MLYQLGAVAAFCRAAGVPLVHAKMHGALSTHVAERSPAVADAIVAAVRVFDAALPLVVLPASELAAAAARAGHPIVREGFPERGYARDGRLLDRSLKGAIIHDPDVAAARGRVDGAQRRVRDPLHPRRQPARGGDRGGPAGGARPRRHRRRRVVSEHLLYVRCADVQGLGPRAPADPAGRRARRAPGVRHDRGHVGSGAPRPGRRRALDPRHATGAERPPARGAAAGPLRRRRPRRRGRGHRSRRRRGDAPPHARPTTTSSPSAPCPASRSWPPTTPRCELPRRPNPRVALPAHTVAIAMHLTTVYPTGSPGGWNILGSALQALYDPHRPEPFLLAAGDRVRLVPTDGVDPPPISPVELLPPSPSLPALRVDEPGLLDLVVDGGRFGQAHDGMAESGPADRAAALLANALVGNPAGTALVEMTLNGPQLTALRPLVVGLRRHRRRARGGRRGRSAGRPSASPPGRGSACAARVAARARTSRSPAASTSGPVLGSASTDVRGLVGRPLRDGDVLGAGRRSDAGRAAAGATRGARPRPADPPAAGTAARRGGGGRALRRRLPRRRRRPHRRAPGRAARSRRRDPVRVAAAGRAAGDAGRRADHPARRPPPNRRLHQAGPRAPGDIGRVAQLRAGDPVSFVALPAPKHGWYLDLT